MLDATVVITAWQNTLILPSKTKSTRFESIHSFIPALMHLMMHRQITYCLIQFVRSHIAFSGGSMFTCREIVKSLIIECPTEALGTFEFRADISRVSDHRFFVQLYEKKMYRLQPFDGPESGQADEMMWVDTSHLFTDESPCSSVEACEQKVFSTLQRFFGPA